MSYCTDCVSIVMSDRFGALAWSAQLPAWMAWLFGVSLALAVLGLYAGIERAIVGPLIQWLREERREQ